MTAAPLAHDHAEQLIARAAAARTRSYSPYSGFEVGAVVGCADGELVPGCLIENVSLGLAMCAERVALFSAVSQGRVPTALVMVAPRTSGRLTYPCGACLQVALELGGADLPIVAADLHGAWDQTTVSGLLVDAPHRHTYGRPTAG